VTQPTTDTRESIRRLWARWDALKQARQPWVEQWRELAEYINPIRSRFLTTDRLKAGSKLNDKIINNRATIAARVQAAGMMSGITSPARPWYALTTADPEMAEYGPVRGYLHILEERTRKMIQKSNLYDCLHLIYTDLVTPGTGALLIEEHPRRLLQGYVFPIGQYAISTNEFLEVDSLYRETSMSVRQMVKKFRLERCSLTVQQAFKRGDLEQMHDVLHAIEPSEDNAKGRYNMPWKSCWLEAGDGQRGQYLHEGGFEEFPAMCPRWQVTAEDAYGSSPAMDALGDIRALQLLEEKGLVLVEKSADPPMRGPTSLMGQRPSLLPGDFTPYDGFSGTKFEPAMEVNPGALVAVRAAIGDHIARINEAFSADLWLMLSQSDKSQMTAREVAERHEEKILQLGPVLEHLQTELLEPMLSRVLGIGFRNGYLPPAPRELQGVELKIEYTSILAQAQRLVTTTGIDRLTAYVINLAQAAPEVLDKVNHDEMVDEMGLALGVKPDLVRTDEEVAQIRANRAKAQAQAAAAEQMAAAAQGAKALSGADLEGDNVLSRMLGAQGELANAGRVR
jgi:hypothetical protein